jgi:hypothetical protein
VSALALALAVKKARCFDLGGAACYCQALVFWCRSGVAPRLPQEWLIFVCPPEGGLGSFCLANPHIHIELPLQLGMWEVHAPISRLRRTHACVQSGSVLARGPIPQRGSCKATWARITNRRAAKAGYGKQGACDSRQREPGSAARSGRHNEL